MSFPFPLPLHAVPGFDFFVADGDNVNSSGAFLRQTVLFTAHETPEMRALFNKTLKNVAGKIRSEHSWPPLQVPEGIEPVGVLARTRTTPLTMIVRPSFTSIAQIPKTNSTNGSTISSSM